MSNQPPIPDNPWATQREPASGPTGSTGVIVVVTILATVVVILAAFAAYLIFGRGGGTETRAAETSATSAPPAVVETVVETVEETVTAAPATTAPTTTSSTTSPAPEVAGLTARGWTASPVIRCGGGESVRYAARDGAGSYITVCSSGNSMTYRSDIFGGTLEMPVDAGASAPSQGYFSVPAGQHRIVIDGDRLEVREGSSVVNSADFAFFYVM